MIAEPTAEKSFSALPTEVTGDEASFNVGRFTCVAAAEVAAAASTRPNPYLWLWRYPAPFVNQSESAASVMRDVFTKICWMSRHPRLGFAWRTSATTPATKGAAADVPPKEEVQSVAELKKRVNWLLFFFFFFGEERRLYFHIRSLISSKVSSGDGSGASTARSARKKSSAVLAVVRLLALHRNVRTR